MSPESRGCSEYGSDVEAYVDGELTPARRASFAAHLDACAPCREALDAQQWLGQALRSLPRAEPSADFAARFWERVEGGDAAAGRPVRAPETQSALGRWLERLRPAPRLEWGLAAAALAALALLLSPGREAALGPEDWAIVANAEEFELLEHGDFELLEALELLEDWDVADGVEEG